MGIRSPNADRNWMIAFVFILVTPTIVLAQTRSEVIERLSSKDAAKVIQQLSDLQSHPSQDPEVVRKVIQLLDDERSIQTNGFFSESVQYSSFFVVSKLGQDDIPVILTEIELLQTTRAKSYLLRAIQNSQKTSDVLYKAILPFLKHEDEGIRGYAIGAISKVASVERELIKTLALKLEDPSDFVRASVILALQSHPIAAGEIVDQVAQILSGKENYYVSISDHSAMSRRLAAEVARLLGQIGTAAKPYMPDLLQAMRTHENKDVRVWAAVASIQLSSEPVPEALAIIGELLWKDSKDDSYSNDAIEGMTVLGTSARSLLDRLRLYAKSSELNVHFEGYRLASAFYAISPDTAIEDVLPLVEKSDDFICSSAIEALSVHNASGERVIAAYIAVLKREDSLSDSREAAIIALRKIGPDAFSAIQAVRKLLELEGLSDYDRKLIQETVNAIQVK